MPSLLDFHFAAIQADDAWQAELVRTFGERATEMRYTAHGKVGPTLGPLWKAKRDADEARRAALMALREEGKS